MVKKVKTTDQKKLTFIKHFFVPQKSNGFRPHAIRWQSLTLTAIISLLTHASYVYFTTGQVGVLGKSVNIDVKSLALETNKIRKKNNLNELIIDARLSSAAQKKADDMIKNNYWSHNSPTGASPWDFINNSGFSYISAGENLAKNYPDIESLISAWMSSETHRKNILNSDFNSVGFAISDGVIDTKITTIIVALYAQSSNQNASIANERSVLGETRENNINNPLTYIGYVIKNLSPITIGTLAVLIGLTFVAVVSHFYREYIPKKIQKSWSRHHGLFKASVLIFMIFVIFITSTGSTI